MAGVFTGARPTVMVEVPVFRMLDLLLLGFPKLRGPRDRVPQCKARKHQVDLCDIVTMFPPPDVSDSSRGGCDPSIRKNRGRQVNLRDIATLFPAPVADARQTRDSSSDKEPERTTVDLLPTPLAGNNRKSRSAIVRQRCGPGLEQVLEMIMGPRCPSSCATGRNVHPRGLGRLRAGHPPVGARPRAARAAPDRGGQGRETPARPPSSNG